jgi:hypothetical protein
MDVPGCLHEAALECSRTGGGPLVTIASQNPQLMDCPSAPHGCPLCAGALAFRRARDKGDNLGPEGANQLYQNLAHWTRHACPHQ